MKEIVIEIRDELYETIIEPDKWLTPKRVNKLVDAVLHGKILPKGHDKLIAEPTEEEIAKAIGGNNEFADCIREAVKAVFNNANAVVDADKEEE